MNAPARIEELEGVNAEIGRIRIALGRTVLNQKTRLGQSVRMRGKEPAQRVRIGLSCAGVRLAGQNHIVEGTGKGRAEYWRIDHRHVLPVSVRQTKFEGHSTYVPGRIGHIWIPPPNRESSDHGDRSLRKQPGTA